MERRTTALIRPGIGDHAIPRSEQSHSSRPNFNSDDSGVIRPLSAEVVAQIQSSVIINSLCDVVFGLLQNSLDAAASKIEIDVDFLRGNCVIEDDGAGIHSNEFGDQGGLVKPYCTSKHNATSTAYGQHGLFLSAIGALSFLSIYSRHNGNRSTNGLIMHHSVVKARHVPAPPSECITSRISGTRVTVRNLFGNMPVRVKQRAETMQEETTRNRQWEEIKRTLAALVLAWRTPVAISLRELNDNKTCRMVIRPSLEPLDPLNSTSIRLSGSWVYSLLLSTGLVEREAHGSWVSVAASSETISVTGLISTRPTPSRHAQFIAVGKIPIASSQQSHELYRYINDIFDRSDFGMVEGGDVADCDSDDRHMEDPRRGEFGAGQKRYAKLSKGVDRWPMFIFNVDDIRQQAQPHLGGTHTNTASLPALLEVFETLVVQWLEKYGYHVHDRKWKRPKVAFDTEDMTVSDRIDYSRFSDKATRPKTRHALEETAGLIGAPAIITLSPRSLRRPLRTILNHGSRIISSKSFTPSAQPLGVDRRAAVRAKSNAPVVTVAAASPTKPLVSLAEADSHHVSLRITTPTGFDDYSDATCVWQDPVTKERYEINARTGQIIFPIQSPSTCQHEGENLTTPTPRALKPVTLSRTRRASSICNRSSDWLRDAMSSWKDPVFRRTEESIPRTESDLLASEDLRPHHRVRGAPQTESDLKDMQTQKLNKKGLSAASIVSQVDGKFVLIKMAGSKLPEHANLESADRELLVLVDQHAADERCRVEDLLRQLLLSPSVTLSSYQSALGHRSQVDIMVLTAPLVYEITAQDASRLAAAAYHFAKWGLLYSIETPRLTGTRNAHSDSHRLLVQTLPPVIAARCQADPGILIGLLRTEIWSENRRTKATTASDIASLQTSTSSSAAVHGFRSESEEQSEHRWLAQLSDIPRGMLDLINSRACRSAIMFNDVLTLDDCRDLVERLARCAFPFQCAHGRPSMVPLVELDHRDTEIAHGDHSVGLAQTHAQGAFWDTFARWQSSRTSDM